jgi:Skp family chaperone for outer membrane proteins
MKFDKLGWFISVALIGAICGMGFQGATPKFGSVDMAKVFNEADQTKTNQSKLREFVKKRMDILQFLQNNSSMNPTDAASFVTLSIKDSPNPSESTQLTKITNDAQTSTSTQRSLVQKQNPTPDDIKQLNGYSSNANQNGALARQLQDQYTTESQKRENDLRDEVLTKVRETVGSIAKKDGYTTVFTTECAPYSANDLTADALKSINGSK